MWLLIKQWVCEYIFHHPAIRVTRVDKTEHDKKDMVFMCNCMNCEKTFLTDYDGFKKIYEQKQPG